MPASAALVAENNGITPCGVYFWLESRAEITNVSHRMDSVIAPDRRAAAAECVDSSSLLSALRPAYAPSGLRRRIRRKPEFEDMVRLQLVGVI